MSLLAFYLVALIALPTSGVTVVYDSLDLSCAEPDGVAFGHEELWSISACGLEDVGFHSGVYNPATGVLALHSDLIFEDGLEDKVQR